MKKYYLFILGLLFVNNFVIAQATSDYAVQLSATVQVSPPSITLNWKPFADSPSIYIYRKSKTSTSWGSTPLATLYNTAATYTDTAVVADSAYEYFVKALGTTTTVPATTATGFVYAGIKAPAIHNRGTLVLLVDSTFTDSCKANIDGLMKDISGDGWQIIRHDLARTMPDSDIHAIIKTEYSTRPNVKAVFILGHIAVPYSGDQNPDAHPNHLGAWPADVYYGNMNGPWTDNLINDISAGYAANKNIPGDGKWDQSQLPSANQLQVSRVDFYNMPVFPKTEVQMMNTYLSRDHSYKMDSISIVRRSLVDDNFGAFGGEAFAANAWRNFPPLLGKDSIKSLDFISTLNTSSYLWAYGCGGGSFTTAGGIGNDTNFANNNINAIFTMLFGSYFGDWNVQNNFLRAPMCSNVPALTSCWAGRPNWFFHHMAIGENIGYSALITQNNTYLYTPLGYENNYVHVALLGDLTLRNNYIKPARNLNVTSTLNAGASLTWTASPDTSVIGYYVYRSDTMYGNYARISNMITATNYTDTAGTNGLKYYMVRPVVLQGTPSGTYYNLGIGITDTATVSYPPSSVITFNNKENLTVFPNPARNTLNLILTCEAATDANISIINLNGQKLYTILQKLRTGDNSLSFNVSALPPGIYILTATTDHNSFTSKWLKAE